MIGLTCLRGIGDVLARQLLRYFGSAEEVFRAKGALLEMVPGIGAYTAGQIVNRRAEVLMRAEKEMAFIEKNKIRLYLITGEDYPGRLKKCQDAPVVFYYRGEADLNAGKVISIVGTRQMTDYGQKMTERVVTEMAERLPGLLVVSGLAYGVDVCAHRCALKNKLPTVGVLAHGLDHLYPAVHRNTAAAMLEHGGLLTDFRSGTTPDRENFLQRNRLIAGLSDATLVIESAERGGSLVTADIAFSYGRDVYAFPGRVTDTYSAGCNRLIQMNKAGSISSAKDLMMSLCWEAKGKASSQQSPLPFPNRPDHPVIRLLAEKGELHVNQLALEMNLPIHKLTPQLFKLEMDGYIKTIPGGVYRLS